MKRKKIKISEILHHAAEYHLVLTDDWGSRGHLYSCDAINAAAHALIPAMAVEVTLSAIRTGLIELGVDPSSYYQFSSVPRQHRQATRYQWLKFCALLAEEQGV